MSIKQDLRYSARMFVRNPGFTVAAVLALGLGIGANSAIFSVVNAVLLNPLNYPDPERLVLLWGTSTREGTTRQPASYLDFIDFRAHSASFEELAAASPSWTFNLGGGSEPERIQGMFVSAGFFSALGVQPSLGRPFRAEEDSGSGDRVVVVGNALWKRYFGSDPGLVGKALSLNGNSYTVIGVMPAGFAFLDEVQLWVPLSLNPFIQSGRAVRLLTMVGRLKPGVGLDIAQAEASSLAAALEHQYPDSNTGVGASLAALHDEVTGAARPALLVLMAAVAFVLLIACANVANLMLSRATARRKEIGIRVALGAGRLRLIRQLLLESGLIALFGASVGLLLALGGIRTLQMLGPDKIPRLNEVSIDLEVLAFTVAISIVTALISGIVPAWQSSEINPVDCLKDGGKSSSSRSGKRIRNVLVVSEVAMAFVLLIGAGLLIRSFLSVLSVRPGFETKNLLTFSVLLSDSVYSSPAARLAFYKQLEERLASLPDIVSVGAITRLPLLAPANNITTSVMIEGRPIPIGELPQVDFRRASTGYFRTMGIPLITGHAFTEREAADGAPVAVINEAFAARFYPGEDPVGRRMRLGPNPDQAPWLTIVGVVGNVRHLALEIEPRPEVYRHYFTLPASGPIIVLRTRSDPRAVIGTLRTEVRALDRNVPVSLISTMDELVSRSVAGRRFSMLLLAVFSAIALALAAVGIYGVLSYAVAQRTREIGIRMALGARKSDIVSMVLRQAITLSGFGIILGLAGTLWATRIMTSLLYGISSADPVTVAGISLLMLAVAIAASYIPARRAAKTEPVIALRSS